MKNVKVLEVMVKFHCKKSCKNGCRSLLYRIRKCTQKNFEGCWVWKDFHICEKLSLLIPVHGDEHIKNRKILNRKGKEEFINGKRLCYHKGYPNNLK